MLYAAFVFFATALLMVGLNVANFKFAHGGGPTVLLLIVMGLAALAAKAVAIQRHH
jgi:hypothetical protein